MSDRVNRLREWTRRPWIVHPFVLVCLPFFATYAENTDSVTLGDAAGSAFPVVLAVAVVLGVLGAELGPRRAALAVSAAVAAVTLHASEGQPFLLIGFAVLAVGVLFLPGDLAIPTTFGNLVAVGLLLTPGWTAFQATRNPTTTRPRDGYLTALDDRVPKPAAGADLPDVWWILLDGHGRQDVLSEKYGVRDDFAGWLEERGFYVASDARSNYIQTAFSVASMLNLEPVEDLLTDIASHSQDRLPVGALARDSRVVHLFRDRGYRIVSYRSEYGLTRTSGADEVRGPRGLWGEFEVTVFGSTVLPWLSRSLTGAYWPIPHAIRRWSLDRTLDDLAEGDRDDGPTLVLAHIVAPHPPFVYDRKGRPTHSRGRSMSDGSHWKRSHFGEDYVDGYAQQVEWLDGRIRTVVDGILAKDPDAVILLQGDHGPGADLDWVSLENTDLVERTSILSAYRLPRGAAGLYPSITPVNSFRVVVDQLFGAALPLLPDRSTWESWRRPYHPIDVTDQLGPWWGPTSRPSPAPDPAP